MRLYLIGEITEEVCAKFIKQMDETRGEKVTIELNSAGGDTYAAAAIASKIREHGLVKIIARGRVMSAALLILASGNVRIADSNTWFMTHSAKQTLKGSAASLKQEAQQVFNEEGAWYRLMTQLTSKDAKWESMSDNNEYFDAIKALALCLIDKTF